MKNFKISCDTSCDLYIEKINKYDISVIPIPYMREKDGQVDEFSIVYSSYDQFETFYNEIVEGYSFRTSQINEFSHEEFFTKLLESGEDVLHFSLSSGLSGTYNEAVKAAEKLNKEHKNKVYVVDTLAATIGAGKLVLIGCYMRENGKSIEEAFEYINDIKHKLQHFFFVPDLKHLRKGGRISAVKAIVGGMLNVKPMIAIDKLGRLSIVGKIKGEKKCISYIIDKLKTLGEDVDNQVLHILHGNAIEEAESFKAEIQKHTTATIECVCVGPIIGTHLGPGSLGLTFIGGERIIKAE